MQTTQNSQFNHVERLNGETRSDDAGGSGGKQDGLAIEGMAVLDTLITEEANVRWQAEQLDSKARELEHEGDDAAQAAAGQLRSQAGLMLNVAAEMSQVISEIRNDPHKKVSRRKVETLRASSATIISISEEEIGEAETAHSGAIEHKEQRHHFVEAQTKAAEKKEPAAKAKCSKKPEKAPAKSTAHAASKKHAKGHDEAHEPAAPKPKRSWIAKTGDVIAEGAHKVVEVTHTVWTNVKETAGDVADGVGNFFSGGIKAVKNMGSTVVSVVTHSAPVVFIAKAGGHVVDALSAAKDNMLNFVGLGADDDEPKEEKKKAAAGASPVMTGQLAAILGKMSLPVLKVKQADPASLFTAPLTPAIPRLPFLAGLPVS